MRDQITHIQHQDQMGFLSRQRIVRVFLQVDAHLLQNLFECSPYSGFEFPEPCADESRLSRSVKRKVFANGL